MITRVLLGVTVALIVAACAVSVIGLDPPDYDIYAREPMWVVPQLYYHNYRIAEDCLGDLGNGREYDRIKWYQADSIIFRPTGQHFSGLFVSPNVITITRGRIYTNTSRHELVHYLAPQLSHGQLTFRKCAGEA